MAYLLTNKDNSPTDTSWVTSGLEPAQLMAETLISRGMLYLASRATDLLVVVRYCGVVLVCILYSSTTSSSTGSQESVMEKVSGVKLSVFTSTLHGGEGEPTNTEEQNTMVFAAG